MVSNLSKKKILGKIKKNIVKGDLIKWEGFKIVTIVPAYEEETIYEVVC